MIFDFIMEFFLYIFMGIGIGFGIVLGISLCCLVKDIKDYFIKYYCNNVKNT